MASRQTVELHNSERRDARSAGLYLTLAAVDEGILQLTGFASRSGRLFPG
ncbi:MAG: hypothetical protein R3F37_18510 [Candidatus Competibacteraceae bacterium]